MGGPEEKRSFGRHRRVCEDNVKMNFYEVGWGSVDRIDVGSIKCGEFLE